MRLIDALKAKYPSHNFQMDAVTGVISFTHEECSITDPFVTECGRFAALASDYGLEVSDAVAIFAHNEPLEATYSLGYANAY